MVYIKDDISSLDTKFGEKVRLCGWIKHIRDVGKIVFWRLIDTTGETQVIFKKGEVPDELIQIAKKATLMSSVVIEGVPRPAKLREAKRLFQLESKS